MNVKISRFAIFLMLKLELKYVVAKFYGMMVVTVQQPTESYNRYLESVVK